MDTEFCYSRLFRASKPFSVVIQSLHPSGCTPKCEWKVTFLSEWTCSREEESFSLLTTFRVIETKNSRRFCEGAQTIMVCLSRTHLPCMIPLIAKLPFHLSEGAWSPPHKENSCIMHWEAYSQCCGREIPSDHKVSSDYKHPC